MAFFVALTPEQRAKGRRNAIAALGPSGCAARATKAAMARWGKTAKQGRNPLVPPLGLLLRWMSVAIDQEEDSHGWAQHKGRILEAMSWLRDAK